MASVASRTPRVTNKDVERVLHQGWTEHYSENYKKWHRYWTVLTVTDVEFYSVITSSGKRDLTGRIAIANNTKVVNCSEEFGFELVTTSTSAQVKDLFRFKNTNDRDLWKSYIIGLTSGNVPDDVSLLPGQLRDVLQAVRQAVVVPPAPPPPPPLPLPQLTRSRQQQCPLPRRPTLDLPPIPSDAGAATDEQSSLKTSVSGPMVDESDLPAADYSDEDDGVVRAYAVGDGRVSVRMHHGVAKVETSVDDETVAENEAIIENSANGLQQLLMRQSSLALKTLEDERKLKRGQTMSSRTGHVVQSQPDSSARVRSRSIGAAGTVAGPRLVAPSSGHHGAREWSWCQQPPRPANNNGHSNDNEVHPFYADPLKNRFPPAWFVDCDRETAESVLLASRNHGNVLMRPSNQAGSYGITMRCDEPSGSRIVHYAVHRTPNGFRIAVENQQWPMYCLSDVMHFFINIVGVSARPLTAVVSLVTSQSAGNFRSVSPPRVVQQQQSVGNGPPLVFPENSRRFTCKTHSEIEEWVNSGSSAGANSWPTHNFRHSPSDDVPANQQRVVLNSTVSGLRSPFFRPQTEPR